MFFFFFFKGIRGLTYCCDFGANLLSVGFENHINIWCPELSLTRAFVGKLEGHSSIVIQCKFIQKSPNCISIDEKSNLRIWDIRTLSPIQIISTEQFINFIDIFLFSNLFKLL